MKLLLKNVLKKNTSTLGYSLSILLMNAGESGLSYFVLQVIFVDLAQMAVLGGLDGRVEMSVSTAFHCMAHSFSALPPWIAFVLRLQGCGCRADSAVKSTCYPPRGPAFGSQHPHGSPLPSVNSSSRGTDAFF